MSQINRCSNCNALITEFRDGIGICSYCGSMFKSVIDLSNVDQETLIIPKGTLEIKDYCYKNNRSIKKVILPDELKIIGESAFEGCIYLCEISIPRSVSIIGNKAFKATGVKELFLHNSIDKLGNEAFMECNDLEKVTLEPGFKYEMNQTFRKCSKLDNILFNRNDFYPSILKSNETPNKRDNRPTFFDAFQGTPYFSRLRDKAIKMSKKGICIFCNIPMSKSLFGAKCPKCNSYYGATITFSLPH